jgi:hypothetical protein
VSRVRRRLAQTLVAIGAGLICTILVSWGSVFVQGFARPSTTLVVSIPHNLPDGLVRVGESRGRVAVLFLSSPFATESRIGPPERWLAPEEAAIPKWCRRRVLHLDPDVPDMLFSEARGWPCVAFSCEQGWGQPDFKLRGGIVVDSTWTRRHERVGLPVQVVIPLTPIWPNLLLDSAFFGALTYLGVFAPREYRRVRRRRRGRCPRCDYDLKHDLAAGCPECGWRRVPAEKVKLRKDSPVPSS